MIDFTLLKPMTLELLGDVNQRRYTDATLKLGFRQALQEYDRFFPHLVRKTVPVISVDKQIIRIGYGFGEAMNVAALQLPDGKITKEFLTTSYPGGSEITLSGRQRNPFAPGGSITLLSVTTNTLTGIDDATQTTIYDHHVLSLITGAAAYAMRIRERSVMEVFGKRPEDTISLSAEAERLMREYQKDLNRLSLEAGGTGSPFPTEGWTL